MLRSFRLVICKINNILVPSKYLYLQKILVCVIYK